MVFYWVLERRCVDSCHKAVSEATIVVIIRVKLLLWAGNGGYQVVQHFFRYLWDGLEYSSKDSRV